MSRLAEVYARFRREGGVADLSDRVKLQLSGADRVRYLNGQVSANVQRLPEGEALPACITTAKGKLCGDVFIRAWNETLLLDGDAALRATLPARVERYIIADDVEVADLSDTWRLLHLLGPAAEAAPPAGISAATRVSRFGSPGLDLLIAAEDFARVSEELRGLLPLDEAFLEALRIDAGVPRWGRELGEETLPPEAGLDRTHIDYHKGCYVGQETLSRLKSVGHVNRALTGFSAVDGAPLIAGAQVFANGEPDRAIGVLTSAGWSFALDTPVALGYLKRGSPRGDLLVRAAGDTDAARPVRVHDLPFAP